ncbi:hypothetical protein RQP46_004993 [Phenoliferia psychrophenolica]
MISAGMYPHGYGFVLLAACSTGFLTVWQGILVSGARKAAGIPYPNAYATAEACLKDEKANKFNCAVRAHANCLEELPWFLFALLYTGIEYPTLAAGSGAFWVLGRIIYTLGYVSGNPKKRMPGSLLFHIGSLGLLVGSTYSAYQLTMSQL